MRVTLVSIAFLSLARSLVPGVYGAPALDHATSLALRQDTSAVTSLLQQIETIAETLLGQVLNLPADVQKTVEEAESLAAGLLPRALSSDATSSKPSTANSSVTTTTSAGLATGAVGSVSSVSESSSKPPTRLRRQLPTAALLSSLSQLLGSLSTLAPAAPSKTGSVSSPSPTSKPGKV